MDAFFALLSFVGFTLGVGLIGAYVGSSYAEDYCDQAAVLADYAHYDSKSSKLVWDDMKAGTLCGAADWLANQDNDQQLGGV